MVLADSASLAYNHGAEFAFADRIAQDMLVENAGMIQIESCCFCPVTAVGAIKGAILTARTILQFKSDVNPCFLGG
jgi:hypothetical protein